MSGNSGCPYFLWGLLAFLGLALVISMIFNISHYVEKQRQDKMYRYSDDYIPSYKTKVIQSQCVGISLRIKETNTIIEMCFRKSITHKNSRDDEYYVEDTPIYGNLDNIIPEPINEDCYEQMKAQPQRSASDTQEATASAQVPSGNQMCYATLDHSFKGNRRRPRKQNANLSDGGKDAQVYAMDTNISQINLVGSFSADIQAVEESIHDDPARLFGLIRAKREPVI